MAMNRENIIKSLGIPPELREQEKVRQKAFAGDIVFSVSPATVSAVSSTGTPSDRTVVVQLQTAAGERHQWFNKTMLEAVTIADTASASTATATIATQTLTFIDGRATGIVISFSSGTWASGDTDTLTINGATILGATVATKTSVQTFADTV